MSEERGGKNKLPLVALLGRPNVGKSTLFNRLLRKRRSITDSMPGVTRDPVVMETEILGRPLRLADTGGYKLDRDPESTQGQIDRVVVEKTLEVLKEADIVVLLFEAGNISLEDEEFIAVLRPYQDKLIVAVNKTEGGRREAEAWNLLSYGFEKVLMISAEHGDRIRDLEEAIKERLDSLGPQSNEAVLEPAPDKEPVIRIALLGKPNTGKSTLSNRLTSSSASIVTNIPGTTRDVVEVSFFHKKHKFQVLDTAGIRRKTRVNEKIEYYSVNRAIKSIDEADIVFLVIDAVEGLSDQDKKIASLAHDRGRGLILVLNKWDLMPDIKNTFEAVRDRIHFLFGQMEYAPLLPVSAALEENNGINKLLNTALSMYRQLNIQVETSALNAALEKWLVENPPPAARTGRFKIRYAVQSMVNPVKFIFFSSRPQAVSENYLAYLRNRIRRDLGFSMIPVSIEIRGSNTDGTRPGSIKAGAKKPGVKKPGANKPGPRTAKRRKPG